MPLHDFTFEVETDHDDLDALFQKVSQVFDGEEYLDVARVAAAIAGTAILSAGNSWQEREPMLRQIVEFMRGIVSGENVKVVHPHRVQ